MRGLFNIASERAIVFCVVIGVTISSSADAAKPSITLKPAGYDFGLAIEGSTITRSFELVNSGPIAINVTDVRTSCGCTAVNIGKETVPPKGSINFAVNLDTSHKSGSVEKDVEIFTSDPAAPLLRLHLTATVISKEQALLPKTYNTAPHPDSKNIANFFSGECRDCHYYPSAGKSGPELYDAICSQCHGTSGKGGTANPLNPLKNRDKTDKNQISGIISNGISKQAGNGTAKTGEMPGFARTHAGPLNADQIESLAELVIGWNGN